MQIDIFYKEHYYGRITQINSVFRRLRTGEVFTEKRDILQATAIVVSRLQLRDSPDAPANCFSVGLFYKL
jgi:hypothetical protein